MRNAWARSSGILLVIGIVGGTGLSWHAQQRQYTLNRQLIDALVKYDTKQAIALLDAGADPNTRYEALPPPSLKRLAYQLLNHSNQPVNGSPTALGIACGAPLFNYPTTFVVKTHGQDVPQLVEALLKHGADANAPDGKKFTALLYAVHYDRCNTVRVLLDYGADVDVRDCNGATPLILGCREAVQPCIVRLLLDHGAHVNAQDEFGDSPLARTVYRDDASLETIRLLLHRGAGVNVQNWDCDTTLYTFVQSHGCTEHPNCLKDREILRLLMAYGGNPNLPNKQGETALRCAQQYERPDLIALMSHVPDHQ